MKKLLQGLLVLLLMGTTNYAISQTSSVSGTVQDENNEPLPGASILLKGTTTGAVTDIDGRFNLMVSGDNPVLVVSFLGYLTQEIAVSNRSNVNGQLVGDLSELGEVGVGGYGNQKKSDLTGAISTLGGRDLAERRTPNISQALQGAVPGVMVTRNNNAPGSSATIRIRGITTIGDSNPLIIMDGVPTSSLDNINPNDIESISVLKDAASASIY